MHHLQNCKVAQMVAPQTVGTSAVSGYVDTLGWDDLTVMYVGGPVATGGVPGTLKLQEGDTTAAFTDISGTVGGTSFTIPTPNTSTGDNVLFHVNLANNRKRYINATVTGTATTRTTNVVAVLSRGAVTPTSAATAGAGAAVFV